MTCSWSEERFERYLDGELDPAERAAFAAHIDACDACRSLLDELRVVDGLLLQPRTIEPAPDFTAATMADVRALPPPRGPASQLPAYLVCYVVAAWSLIGAGLLLNPRAMAAFVTALRAVASTIVVALGGVAHVANHLGDRGEYGAWSAFAGTVVTVDVMLVLALLGARFVAVPWLAQRQRS